MAITVLKMPLITIYFSQKSMNLPQLCPSKLFILMDGKIPST